MVGLRRLARLARDYTGQRSHPKLSLRAWASIWERTSRATAKARRQKSPNLGPQRLFGSNRWFINLDFGVGGRAAFVASDRECQHVLPTVVNGYILPRLKEPQLADPLGRNSAGGEVGHTSRLEFNPRIRDINLVRQN